MVMEVTTEGLSFLENAMDVKNQPLALKSLNELKEGNRKFVENRGIYYKDVNKPTATEQTAFYNFLASSNASLGEIEHHQTPTKAILACSDSRVTPAVIFSHVGFNLLFEVRNAGNIFTPEAEESMVVPASHNTPLFVICGHSNCGAMNACANVRKTNVANEGMPATVANLQNVAPASVTEADEIAKYNIANVAYRFASSKNPVLKDVFKTNKMKIAPAMYNISSGKVDFFDFALIKQLLLDNSH